MIGRNREVATLATWNERTTPPAVLSASLGDAEIADLCRAVAAAYSGTAG
jgi:hypothetical protein